MSETTRPELPPKYYLENFRYVLDFVRKLYLPLLTPPELDFLDMFDRLSEDAQCLFVRFSNRRGAFFKVNSLSYAELSDIPASLTELLTQGFAENLSEQHAPRAGEVIDLFSKPELLLLSQVLMPAVPPPKNIRKPDLVRWLLHEFSFEELLTAMQSGEPVIKVCYEVEVMMMKFLFFGNRHDGMTEFVVRDLGYVRYQSFQEENFSVRFETRKDVEDRLMLSLTAETFYELKEEVPPEEIYDWFMNWQGGLVGELSEVALPSYRRLVLRIGAWLERKKMPEQALTVYQLTSDAPSRERRARLLHRIGELEEALALCDEMIQSPQNADERFLGLDYREKIVNKKKRVIRQTTLALKAADAVEIAVSYRHQVEKGVIDYYLEQGYAAIFSENEPWRALFGLVFWDIIYDTNVRAIHHPLQRVPSDFFLPDFFTKREKLLRQRLVELSSAEAFESLIVKTYLDKLGTTNVLVAWYEGLLEAVLVLTSYIKPEQLHLILMEMALNLRENTRGFPDLLVWKDDFYSLVEVKSPTDHLSSQQLNWLHFFEQINVRSKVLRVDWIPEMEEKTSE
ncbi:VRR-NUC domain-containing protein [Arundinibacter roseus]|uniref:phosphodiesterase I n=1 Tax=Arundinibacter roseus TaxID=2070510 RepID=A0A4R4KIN3_9BACT|nr:VRR-NUC domain-containing protein [Arundinibacter roseus]TDB68080.1 VRR-NUC domain-containing protein [Arundinibacter roseus]